MVSNLKSQFWILLHYCTRSLHIQHIHRYNQCWINDGCILCLLLVPEVGAYPAHSWPWSPLTKVKAVSRVFLGVCVCVLCVCVCRWHLCKSNFDLQSPATVISVQKTMQPVTCKTEVWSSGHDTDHLVLEESESVTLNEQERQKSGRGPGSRQSVQSYTLDFLQPLKNKLWN